ncbi:type II secretion system F family protein [Photobacterium leiognathi]|uniref:hypothetical protein n=1 Tax=Photobacterium leiognathi TaxID=553611 RepID=UPI0029823071|nr:hypothetical protein [Photobacterium leiognathi]
MLKKAKPKKAKLKKAKLFSNEWFAQRSFNRKIQLEFIDDLIVAIRCNLSVKDQLEQFVKYGNPKVQKPARYMLEVINKAKPFSVAMEGWFPSIVIQAVKAGEANRNVAYALENAKDVLKNGGIVGKVIGSNAYSIFLIAAATIANIVSYLYIFKPKLEEVQIRFWSQVSRIAYYIGDTFVNDSQYILIVLAIAYVLFSKFMGMKTSKVRSKFDHFPIFEQYRLYNAVTLLSSLTLMFESKMAINRILPLLKGNTQGYLQSHVELMEKRLHSKKSLSLADVIDSGLFNEGEIARIKALTSKNSREVGFVLKQSTLRHQLLLDNAIKKYGVILQAFSYLYMASMLLITFIGITALNMIGL